MPYKFFKLFFISSLIFLMSAIPLFGQAPTTKKLKEVIWAFEEIADKNFGNSHTRFEIHKTVKGKVTKETYLFSQNKKGIEKLVVEFLKDDVKEIEEYYFNEGRLVLAREIIYFKFENEWTDKWSVNLYIHKGKVFDMMSNGHGKTEDDNWEPKPLELSKKRVRTLKKHLKKINL